MSHYLENINDITCIKQNTFVTYYMFKNYENDRYITRKKYKYF